MSVLSLKEPTQAKDLLLLPLDAVSEHLMQLDPPVQLMPDLFVAGEWRCGLPGCPHSSLLGSDLAKVYTAPLSVLLLTNLPFVARFVEMAFVLFLY